MSEVFLLLRPVSMRMRPVSLIIGNCYLRICHPSSSLVRLPFMDKSLSKSPSVTVADVARRAGVSKATAARVLGGYGTVSDRVREAVTAAASSLDYRPNELARSMTTGRSGTIGVVVGDIENPSSASRYAASRMSPGRPASPSFSSIRARTRRRRRRRSAHCLPNASMA